MIFTILIIVLPYIIPSNGLFTFAVPRNNTVTISFNITAIPAVKPADIQWYFKSTLVELINNTNKYIFSSNHHSLTISNVQVNDIGTYRITAANIIGSNQTDVDLIVYGMLNIKINIKRMCVY